jgi:hypothetical protein
MYRSGRRLDRVFTTIRVAVHDGYPSSVSHQILKELKELERKIP